MQRLIDQLLQSVDLDAAEVEHAVAQLTDPAVSQDLKAAFLRALREKGETAAEIAAFAHSLLARAISPGLEDADLPGPMIDVCGTGGDRLELFNISTTAMFILAAGGASVVKHGNRAITSKSGGADVLEALGVRIDLPPESFRKCMETHGLGFLFAPAYHPAFKEIGPVRKQLAAEGIPTVFNLLGPLLNPARPPYQLVGVFSPALLPKYAETLAVMGRAHAWAVHGSGMDELSLSGTSAVHEVANGLVRDFIVDPATLGLPHAEVSAFRGGMPAENAAILVSILDGTEKGPRRDIVLLNAAASCVITRLAPTLAEGLEIAREQIVSGRALEKLHALQQFTA
jgi:anthranilate phosphoribosyltransferase